MTMTCITDAKIWTGVEGADGADTLIMQDSRIVAVGRYGELRSHPLFAESRKVGLGGKPVVPGLSDSHIHLLAYAKQKLFADLSGARDKADMLAILSKRAQRAAPADWVCGFNFNETSWPESLMPDKNDLDSLDIPNPVLIQRTCTHATVLNSKALELCGLNGDVQSDGLLKDGSGEPNGILVEEIQAVAHSRMGRDMYGRSTLLELLKKSLYECASHGLTAIFACGADSLGMEELMDLYQELRHRGELRARVFSYHDTNTVPRMSTGFGDRWLAYQGYKIFLDGSLGARTAALSAPYSDAPSETGMLLHTTADMSALLSKLAEIGCQALVHTIGDGALDQLLDALENSLPGWDASKEFPFVIVNHCMICRPDQVERMRRLGAAGATIQPTFVQSDRNMAPARLGDRIERNWAYPWKNLTKAGIVLNGSSDCPIESLNPWHGIHAAVSRHTDCGIWMPEQCLSVEEALRIYTVNPAANAGAGSWRGSLEAGKEADLVVIDRDIFHCSVEELKDVNVLCTIVGGKVTYGELEG